MRIDASFPGGNIEFVGVDAGGDARLRLRSDPVLNYSQWFYFAVGPTERALNLRIENAGEALIPAGWPDYQAFASEDRVHWRRVDTNYRDGVLAIPHAAGGGTVFYAYFPPYEANTYAALKSLCAADERVAVDELCATGSGGSVDLIRTLGHAPGPARIWVLCRQHPGEVQASWWADGFLRALLDRDDVEARRVLERARVFVVPNMNPDGSARGHHRTNALGVNLNAVWSAPRAETAPSVFEVQRQMDLLGVDFCLDVHGDEELPHAFAARVDTLVPIPPDLARVRDAFEAELAAIDPLFKADGGYVRPHTVADPLAFCGPFVMRTYGAPALTLELPYKTVPDGSGGRLAFGAEEAARLGRACLQALNRTLDGIDALRASRLGKTGERT